MANQLGFLSAPPITARPRATPAPPTQNGWRRRGSVGRPTNPKDNFRGLTNPAIAFKAYNHAKPGEPLPDKAMARATIEDLKADALAGCLPQVIWIGSPQSACSRIAKPMRADCAELTEVMIDAGDEVMLERTDETNAALADWIAAKQTMRSESSPSDCR